jgi:hypothetical protein
MGNVFNSSPEFGYSYEPFHRFPIKNVSAKKIKLEDSSNTDNCGTGN